MDYVSRRMDRVRDEVAEVSCRVCPGLIDRVSPAEAEQAALEHFAQLHPGWRPVAGRDYDVLADPGLVCDTCLARVEPPWWLHISTPPTPSGGGEALLAILK
jgi:hypothetical protein